MGIKYFKSCLIILAKGNTLILFPPFLWWFSLKNSPRKWYTYISEKSKRKSRPVWKPSAQAVGTQEAEPGWWSVLGTPWREFGLKQDTLVLLVTRWNLFKYTISVYTYIYTHTFILQITYSWRQFCNWYSSKTFTRRGGTFGDELSAVWKTRIESLLCSLEVDLFYI